MDKINTLIEYCEFVICRIQMSKIAKETDYLVDVGTDGFESCETAFGLENDELTKEIILSKLVDIKSIANDLKNI